jgi:hypothetical protein
MGSDKDMAATRVSKMEDDQIRAILVDKEGWQDAIYDAAVFEANKRNITAIGTSEESIKNQAENILQMTQRLIHDSEPLQSITRKLIERGIPEIHAKETVKKEALSLAQAKSDEYDNVFRRNLMICGGGVLVTIITFITAIGGGTYVLAWGAILLGGVKAAAAYPALTKWRSVVKESMLIE